MRIVYLRLSRRNGGLVTTISKRTPAFHLLACFVVFPLSRRDERIPLENICRTVAVHDQIHLRRANQKGVDVHAEKITSPPSSLTRASDPVANFFFWSLFFSFRIRLSSRRRMIHNRDEESPRSATAVQYLQ